MRVLRTLSRNRKLRDGDFGEDTFRRFGPILNSDIIEEEKEETLYTKVNWYLQKKTVYFEIIEL